MAKIKTKKAIKKRFKLTKAGRLVYIRSGKILSGRRAKKIKRMLTK